MYEYKTRVDYSQIDPDGRMNMSGVMNAIQNCIIISCEDLGIGIHYLKQFDFGWFVANYGLRIHRLPMLGDSITTITKPYKIRGMLGYRYTCIVDENGEVLVESDSVWVLMNLKTLTPSKVTPLMTEKLVVDEDPKSDLTKGRPEPVENLVKKDEFMVMPSMIDSNGHMNNTYYVDLASRYLDEPFEKGVIKINYKEQVLAGEQLSVYTGQLPDDAGTQVCLSKAKTMEDGSVTDAICCVVDFRNE